MIQRIEPTPDLNPANNEDKVPPDDVFALFGQEDRYVQLEKLFFITEDCIQALHALVRLPQYLGSSETPLGSSEVDCNETNMAMEIYLFQ